MSSKLKSWIEYDFSPAGICMIVPGIISTVSFLGSYQNSQYILNDYRVELIMSYIFLAILGFTVQTVIRSQRKKEGKSLEGGVLWLPLGTMITALVFGFCRLLPWSTCLLIIGVLGAIIVLAAVFFLLRTAGQSK